MTRNQKIALGCGGAGCLGLIVVAIAGVLIYFLAYRSSYDRYANYNDNYNANRSANRNSNDNENADDDSTNSSSSSSSSSSADDMTEDEKHKLFQAAAVTRDMELQRRVWIKIGIMEDNYTPGPKYEEFIGSHVAWATRNYQWVASMDSPEKGRAYVDEHLD